MQNQIYIYLAKRDKKGIKLLANFPHKTKTYPIKVKAERLESFQFSFQIKNLLYSEIEKNKLNYELYLESASSFNELKKSLSKRGYTNLPIQQFNLRLEDENQTINENLFLNKKSLMIRRKSDQARLT
jgi:hypothetical protein